MSAPNRTPAGVPTGGQFATSVHAESTIALTEAPAVPKPVRPRYDSLEALSAAGYVTAGWERWQQGLCATYAIALVQAHPHLRFAVMGRSELGGGDASGGWSETHCFAHDDRYAYDSAGRHSLPYLGVAGDNDYVELDSDPDYFGYLDDCDEADLAEAKRHALTHNILHREPVPLGGVPRRHEAFPLESPAAHVKAFRGKPVGTWVGSGGEHSMIAADGSYVTVAADTEDTDHWFIDGVRADGTDYDGGCLDSEQAAKTVAAQHLNGTVVTR